MAKLFGVFTGVVEEILTRWLMWIFHSALRFDSFLVRDTQFGQCHLSKLTTSSFALILTTAAF